MKTGRLREGVRAFFAALDFETYARLTSDSLYIAPTNTDGASFHEFTLNADNN